MSLTGRVYRILFFLFAFYGEFYRLIREKEYEMTKANAKFDTKYMVKLALMVGIVLLMSMTPLGYVKTPALSVTLLTVPVAVGAILLGPLGGIVCGAAFGFSSLFKAITEGGFAGMLFSINPFATFILCVIARILDGWMTGLIFKGLHRGKTSKISYYAASLACPLLNTVFFMGFLVIFFYNTEFIQGFVTTLGETFPIAMNPITFIIAFVGIQGLIEAVICFLVASAVSRTLYRVLMHE